jgi:hypothetical protein
MKKLVLCFLFFASVCAGGVAHAQSAIDPRGILAVAKITGACGVIKSMYDFQESTQMEGGDAFLARWLAMESARRGMTPEEVAQECNNSIDAYNNFSSAIEESMQKE